MLSIRGRSSSRNNGKEPRQGITTISAPITTKTPTILVHGLQKNQIFQNEESTTTATTPVSYALPSKSPHADSSDVQTTETPTECSINPRIFTNSNEFYTNSSELYDYAALHEVSYFTDSCVLEQDFLPRPPANVATNIRTGTSDSQVTLRGPSDVFDTSVTTDRASEPFAPGGLVDITSLDISSLPRLAQQVRLRGRLPDWIQHCTQLEYLTAVNADLTAIDEWVSEKLVNLKVLRLSGNNITTWPHHLARLLQYNRLEVIDLDFNPCLNHMFQKCSSFQEEYISAAGSLSNVDCSDTMSSASISKRQSRGHLRQKSDSKASEVITVPEKTSRFRGSDGRLFKKSARHHVYNRDSDGVQKELKSQKQEQTFIDNIENDNDSEDDDTLTSLHPIPLAHFRLGRNWQVDSSLGGVSRYESSSCSSEAYAHRMDSIKSRGSSNTATSVSSSRASTNTSLSSISSVTSSMVCDHNAAALNAVDMSDILESDLQNRRRTLITESYIDKSKVIMRLMRDIHELTTGNLIQYPKESEIQSKRSSAPSIYKSQDRGSFHESENNYSQFYPRENTQSTSIWPSMVVVQQHCNDAVLHIIEDFVEKELQFVETLSEFFKLEIVKPNVEDLGILGNLPDIYRLHADVICPALGQGLNEFRQGRDPKLTNLASLLVDLIRIMGIYTQYSYNFERISEDFRLWIQRRLSEQTPMATLLSKIQSHSRANSQTNSLILCLNNPENSGISVASSLIHCLELPLDHLEEWRHFTSLLRLRFPSLSNPGNLINALVNETIRVRPLMLFSKRKAELARTFHLEDESAYGDFVCDAGISLRRQVALEEIPIGHRYSDVVYNTTINLSKEYTKVVAVPKSVMFTNFHALSLEDTTLRLLIYSKAILLADDKNGQIIGIFERTAVKAIRTELDMFSTGDQVLVKGGPSENRNNTKEKAKQKQSTNAIFDRYSSIYKSKEFIRLTFKDVLEVWYCSLERYYGAENLHQSRTALDYLISHLNGATLEQ